jgi:hypothetical protein
MRQSVKVAAIAAGCIGAAWLFDRNVVSGNRPRSAAELDGVWLNGQWYHVQAGPGFETIRNFLLQAETAGYDFAQNFKITGRSGVTHCWPSAGHPLTGNEVGGGFTLADVENWQSAGISYN